MVIVELDCNQIFAVPRLATSEVVIAEVVCDHDFALPLGATDKMVIAELDCDQIFAVPRLATSKVVIARSFAIMSCMAIGCHRQDGDRAVRLRSDICSAAACHKRGGDREVVCDHELHCHWVPQTRW